MCGRDSTAEDEFEDEEDQVFWTMVVNTLEGEEGQQQSVGEEEEELDDVIGELFFDAADDFNQQQNHQGLPPSLPADKDVEIAPCRRGED